MIYLDAAATTKPEPKVIKAMMPYLEDNWFNPSSLYRSVTSPKQMIVNTRSLILQFLNAKYTDKVYFTSCGSESNCWAIQGFISYWLYHNKSPVIITSKIEHKSILSCIETVVPYYCFINVDDEGFIDTNELESALKRYSKIFPERKILVSVQFANNEIGTIQKIKEISKMVHMYGGYFHTDAVQAFGHTPIDVQELGIDMLSASGHKIGTPKGIGILYKKNNISINPIIFGTQMDGMRGGTENVPYIAGLAEAINIRKEYLLSNKILYVKDMRDYMIKQLKEKFDCKINGSLSHRLFNNINVSFKQNITGEALIYLLDMCDIYISAGSACNSHSTVPSYVLKAIGLSDDEAMKTIRITLPDDITMEQIDKVICELEKQIKLITS